jgi:hypothetical protein
MVRNRTPAILVAAGLVLAAALIAYVLWSAHQNRVHREAVAAAVGDTTARLRETLGGAPLEPKKVEAHAAAAEAHLEVLKNRSRNRELADAAEHYVIGAREIFKRQAAAISGLERIATEKDLLTQHIGRAARRDREWINEAMARKKKVEAVYFDYNLALTGLSELLWGFPKTRKNLLPHLAESALLEVGPAEDAYRRVQAESKRVADELAAVRRIQ